MITKWLSFTLICLLVVTTSPLFISAQTNTEKTASSIAKVKRAVEKRRRVFREPVKVEMLNGTQLKGYISQTGEDSFELTNSETNQVISIAYRDVEQVKKLGSKGETTALWIIGGAAAVGAVVLGSFLIRRSRN
jgi:sRNA-binding regulator protein Hfq